MSTYHCAECGSELCNHGNCPQCRPCEHCYGGDRSNKFFGYDRDEAGNILEDEDTSREPFPHTSDRETEL